MVCDITYPDERVFPMLAFRIVDQAGQLCQDEMVSPHLRKRGTFPKVPPFFKEIGDLDSSGRRALHLLIVET